jgi:pimeloyl-ACP methyl ester carboxylesterase
MLVFFLVTFLATTSICEGDNLSEDQTTDKVQTIQVGDINMAYMTLGQSEPLIMIMAGFGATMDVWSSQLLEDLSSRYRVIILDNRGRGNTTATAGNLSIAQFANDTAGLMDTLHIKGTGAGYPPS